MQELTGKYTNCKIFTDYTEQSAISQVYEFLNHPAFENCQTRFMPDCLDEDSEVLTERGFVKITNLKKEDKVGNCDINTKEIFFAEPKDIIVRDKREDEKVFSFYSQRLNTAIITSENHRNAYVQDMGRTTKELDDITYHKDFLWGGQGVQNNTEKYDDNTLLLLMWIVGDGSIKKTHNERSTNFRIRFGFKKDRKIKRVLELCDRLNLAYTYSTSAKQSDIIITTKSSKSFIEIVGIEKTLPNLLNLNQRQATLVKDELIKIDGNYENYLKQGNYVLNTCKEKEANMYASFLAINFGSTKTSCRKMKSYDKTKSIDMYTISLTTNEGFLQNRNGLPNSKIVKKELKYNKKLVCITCDTGFFVVRQNGRSFVTGNCHAGSGAVIGTTVELSDKVIPNTIGVDIGCGMYSVKLSANELDYKALDRTIKQNVPSGFNINNRKQTIPKSLEQDIIDTCKEIGIDTHRALFSLGSLGGGNHFVEVGRDEQNFLWLTIHSGSRNFGLQIAKFHQKIAEQNYKNPKPDLTNIPLKERSEYIRKFKELRVKIPKGMEYLTGEDKALYEKHMKVAQRYASESRKIMVNNILRKLDCEVLEEIESIHNYIDFDAGIIRKGAISAQKDELVIIPWNMRDGLIIGRGLGNPDWNFSAPHGAGRTMSRSQAKKEVGIDEFKESMEGIYSSCVSEATLDESLMVYKDHNDIEKYLSESVEILHRVKPEYNFKA